jgi:integrase
LRDFARARDWERFHTPKNLAMALAGEAGELMACFQWLTPEESARAMDDPGIAAGAPAARWPAAFKRYSGGNTLHQLRHSRLTHLGDQKGQRSLLMAISGHKRLATLQRYVEPSQAAIAALMAASDPDSRGR